MRCLVCTTLLRPRWRTPSKRRCSTSSSHTWCKASYNRKNRAVERAVRAAQFRYNAALDDVGYTFERGLDRNQVGRLAAMEFVRDHKDLIITRSTGTG